MNKLKRYLKHKRTSQKDFAEIIGTTPNNLGLLVLGKSTPSLATAHRIEVCTGGLVTLYDWITDEMKSFQPPEPDPDSEFCKKPSKKKKEPLQ